jgi:hypothetical protein
MQLQRDGWGAQNDQKKPAGDGDDRFHWLILADDNCRFRWCPARKLELFYHFAPATEWPRQAERVDYLREN